MNSTIVIRNIKPSDKSWIRREAIRRGISMEELVRRVLHEAREYSDRRLEPSAAFQRHFGVNNGVELPLSGRYGYKAITVANEDAT